MLVWCKSDNNFMQLVTNFTRFFYYLLLLHLLWYLYCCTVNNISESWTQWTPKTVNWICHKSRCHSLIPQMTWTMHSSFILTFCVYFSFPWFSAFPWHFIYSFIFFLFSSLFRWDFCFSWIVYAHLSLNSYFL